MAIKTKHFALHELVCPHVLNKYGEQAWQFLDPRFLITMDWIWEKLAEETGENPVIELNNYKWGGDDDQSGLRCNMCDLVKDKTDDDLIYMSGHQEGQAGDFSIKGWIAERVRNWLVRYQDQLPYPIRLESGVKWVHLDVRDAGQKIYTFNPYK